jgi:hypothetical protein
LTTPQWSAGRSWRDVDLDFHEEKGNGRASVMLARNNNADDDRRMASDHHGRTLSIFSSVVKPN